jgi:hypothetical protein
MMRHRTNTALFNYWDTVRAGRLAPQRFEIEPSRISALLPYTFILEKLDAETFRFRLAGTRMCDIVGRELRGTTVLDGWTAMDRLPLLRQFSVMTGQGAAVILYAKLSTLGNDSVECEMLLLPLLHTGGAVDRVLGSFAPLDSPVWLAEMPVTKKELLRNELVWPDREPLTLISQPREFEDADVIRERSARIVRAERRQFRVLDGGLAAPDVEET